jgi:hypothetical protein
VPAAEHLVGPADEPSRVGPANGVEPGAPVIPGEPAFGTRPAAAAANGAGAAHTPPAGWIESGVHVMVMPLTMAIVAAIAPVIWMLAPRAHR